MGEAELGRIHIPTCDEPVNTENLYWFRTSNENLFTGSIRF